MHEIRTSVRRAPWGFKRYYAPLPVLSILLLTTALAAPDILRTNFLIYQDSGTTIVATVQQVVHLSGPTGKIVGIASVTNTRSFPIRILALSAALTRDGTPASPIMLTINVAPGKFPIDIAAGDTAKIQWAVLGRPHDLGLRPDVHRDAGLLVVRDASLGDGRAVLVQPGEGLHDPEPEHDYAVAIRRSMGRPLFLLRPLAYPPDIRARARLISRPS